MAALNEYHFAHIFRIMFYIKLLFGFITVWIHTVSGDELCYKLDFSENPKDCDDFKNDKYDPSGLQMVPVDGPDGEEKFVGLSGPLVFNAEIEDGYELKIDVLQETEHGREPAMSVVTDICSSLSQEDAPWKPVVDAMNVTACPIPIAEYPFKEMVLSLDFAKDILTHQYVGDYFIAISITQKTNTLACFTMGAIISEFDCPEEK